MQTWYYSVIPNYLLATWAGDPKICLHLEGTNFEPCLEAILSLLISVYSTMY